MLPELLAQENDASAYSREVTRSGLSFYLQVRTAESERIEDGRVDKNPESPLADLVVDQTQPADD
jgi:hypothetical protein